MGLMGAGAADLNATVDANVQPYERALERAQMATFKYETSIKSLDADLRRLEKQLDDDIAAALNRQHQAMDKTGRAFVLGGAAIAAGLAMAANEAIKWETAWTGVTKTVNGSGAQMVELEGDLRRMATTLPATHEEIAGVAEAAGQLGIRREDIAAFTKTMIDLGVSTNLTAEDAATGIAQMMNIMQSAPEDVGRVGAALVALGNNGASTEAQILEMAQRISGAGHQLGMSEAEVLSIANALASVGIEAEAGGSSISMVMKTIQLAVSTNSAKLEQWAAVAGMSVEKFKALWTQDSARGLDAIVTGLGNVKASGGDAIKTLNDLGVKQIRQSDALLRLAGAGDLLTQSLDMGNKAWDENTALLNEANKRYGTTAAKVAIARNQLRDTAIDVGEVLVPAIAKFARVTGDLIGAWQDLPGPIKTATTILAALTAGVLLFGGAALIAVPKIFAFKAAVTALEAGALKTAGTRLIGLGGILAGPWGLALTAGISLLGFFAVKHQETSRSVDEVVDSLDKETGAVTENTREWAKKKLYDEGALQAANQLGLNLETVTDAALGNSSAIREVNAELETHIVKLGQSTSGNSDLTGAQIEASNAAKKVQGALGDTNGALDDARTKLNLFAKADGEAAAGSDKVAGAQKGVTMAWSDGASAASDLNQEVKTLGDQLKDLSNDYLSNRDAGRQVRDSLRGIHQAVKQFKDDHEGSLAGAFKAGTKSGDEFAGMLDDLAGRYQEQINTVEQLTGSEKRTWEVYRTSRARLMEVAQQLGMTKAQAKDYVDQVLQVPAMAKTLFQTPGLDQSQERVMTYASSLRGLPPQVQTEILTVRRTEWRSGGAGSAPAPSPAPDTPNHKAAGGFVFGNREPQLRTGGGAVTWAEPETGWEAYISGKPGMESRNRAVWSEAGRRLGYAGARLAGGGGTHTIERVVEKLPDSLEFDLGSLGRIVVDTATGISRHEISETFRRESVVAGE